MKRVLIIGATSSIANACARLWAKQGAHFFLVARDPVKLETMATDLKVRGATSTHSWRMDANDLAAHPLMVEAGIQALGSIDIALVAHGTLPDQRACEADALCAVRELTTNGTSVIALLTVLANQFSQQRSGALAVITSVAGDRGRPSNYVYGSAKASVSSFCEGLRARLFTHGISVTDIRPGFVATPMTKDLLLPRALVAQPEAVARRIVAGIERGASILYVPAFWSAVMFFIKMIPGPIFKRIKL